MTRVNRIGMLIVSVFVATVAIDAVSVLVARNFGDASFSGNPIAHASVVGLFFYFAIVGIWYALAVLILLLPVAIFFESAKGWKFWISASIGSLLLPTSIAAYSQHMGAESEVYVLYVLPISGIAVTSSVLYVLEQKRFIFSKFSQYLDNQPQQR